MKYIYSGRYYQCDIYLRKDGKYIVCGSCSLWSDKRDLHFTSRTHLITHLISHLRHEHKVPFYIVEKLWKEIEEYGDRV